MLPAVPEIYAELCLSVRTDRSTIGIPSLVVGPISALRLAGTAADVCAASAAVVCFMLVGGGAVAAAAKADDALGCASFTRAGSAFWIG